jgi:agmatinase
MIHTIAAEGLCGMEVVEVSHLNDNTAQLACRIMLDVLETLVSNGHIGHRNKVMS